MKIFFTLFAMLPLAAYSQLTIKSAEVGSHNFTGEQITANVYCGGRYFWSWHFIDGGTKIVTAEVDTKGGRKLKNKGIFACYDLADGSVIWEKEANYKWQKPLFYDSVFVVEEYGSSLMKNYYDYRTGELLHRSSAQIVGSLPEGNILSHSTVGFKSTLNSVRPDGKVLWEMECGKFEFPCEHYMLNDSILLVIGEGLYYINIVDQSGWYFDATTTIANREVAPTLKDIRKKRYWLNYHAGDIVVSTPPFIPFISEVYTNVCEEGDYLYWGFAKGLVCIDKSTGEPLWEVSYEDGSQGQLMVWEGKLYHFNQGSVKIDQYSFRLGTSYIAVYDCLTGELLDKTFVDRMISLYFDDDLDRIFYTTADGIYSYWMDQGQTVEYLQFRDIGTDFIPFYLRGDALLEDKESGTFKFIYQKFPYDSFILAIPGEKCSVLRGSDMQVISDFDWDDIIIPVKYTESLYIVSSGDTQYFLNISQEAFACVSVGFEAQYEGNYIFWCDGNNIYRVDMTDFMPEQWNEEDMMDYGIDMDGIFTVY